ncbi:unnamed protein product [Microthlaspi erraticum]|uniref:FBD domain-containing protein n=1 Tax=Microthlaspi erraticum TaxID=1685480 RepID=A0A6D2KZP8_9BRAS|nr:unnamed protein product [Microthlaspi erraticum]
MTCLPSAKTFHNQNHHSHHHRNRVLASSSKAAATVLTKPSSPQPLHSSSASPAILPRSLYTGIRMLVTLQLNSVILVDVASPVSFPTLKYMKLCSVKYPGDEFVKRFLSSCIVLERLGVEQCPGDNVTVFTVRVPSLESVYLHKSYDKDVDDADDAEGFVINAPSLKYLGITDTIGGYCVIENEMPNIARADVEADYKCVSNILGSITSVKRLHLCSLYSKDVYPVRSVFHHLIHLKICTCDSEWLNLFMPLLRDSPKLQSLELDQCHIPDTPRPCWIEPSSVPECLLASLETLQWVKYGGREEEKQVAAFILRNGSCLKKRRRSCSSSPLNENYRISFKGFGVCFRVHLMDRISQLPEALLLKILSLLPNTKDVVSTMVLSKRWQFLWMHVPKLVYDDSCKNIAYGKFSRFVDRSMLVHEAPVIETLQFKLGKTCVGEDDIQVWIRAAKKCCVRELIIEMVNSSSSVTLPRSLYSGGCRMLMTLKLSNAVLVDASSLPSSFPSLRNLSLVNMKYPGDEFVEMLMSKCPVLEDLVVKRCHNDHVTVFSVRVPSLKSLVLHKLTDRKEDTGFRIDAMSLESLSIEDYSSDICVVESNMSKIVEANVSISYGGTEKLMGCVSSAKRLYLCVPSSKNAYPVDSVFHCLIPLNSELSDLNSAIPFGLMKQDRAGVNQVELPVCLSSSLETLDWVKYQGAEEEKEVAAFILRSGCCLKKVTISTNLTDLNKKLEMLKDLSLFFRRSPTCQIAFD